MSIPTIAGQVQAAPQAPAESIAAAHARLLAERDQLLAEIEQASAGQVRAGDPRLAHVWALAERYARAAGHIGEYNTLAREMDGPVRESTYDVRVDVSLSTSVTVTVMAENADDAMEMVEHGQVTDALYGYDLGDAEVVDWQIDDAEEVE